MEVELEGDAERVQVDNCGNDNSGGGGDPAPCKPCGNDADAKATWVVGSTPANCETGNPGNPGTTMGLWTMAGNLSICSVPRDSPNGIAAKLPMAQRKHTFPPSASQATTVLMGYGATGNFKNDTDACIYNGNASPNLVGTFKNDLPVRYFYSWSVGGSTLYGGEVIPGLFNENATPVTTVEAYGFDRVNVQDILVCDPFDGLSTTISLEVSDRHLICEPDPEGDANLAADSNPGRNQAKLTLPLTLYRPEICPDLLPNVVKPIAPIQITVDVPTIGLVSVGGTIGVSARQLWQHVDSMSCSVCGEGVSGSKTYTTEWSVSLGAEGGGGAQTGTPEATPDSEVRGENPSARAPQALGVAALALLKAIKLNIGLEVTNSTSTSWNVTVPGRAHLTSGAKIYRKWLDGVFTGSISFQMADTGVSVQIPGLGGAMPSKAVWPTSVFHSSPTRAACGAESCSVEIKVSSVHDCTVCEQIYGVN